MLFGSQFLREVYADDDKSMSKVSIDLRELKKATTHSKKPDSAFKSPGKNLNFVHNSQNKQALFDKNMKNPVTAN